MANYLRQILPNLLTMSRVIVIPAIILSFYIESDISTYITLLIFSFACVTDFFDGYLARIWKVQSKFGRLFDPIADKLIVVSTIVMLVYIDKITGFIVIPAIIIICREILISGLREFLITMDIKMPVNGLGKVKTLVQMVAIAMLILDNHIIVYLGKITFCTSAILAVYSGYLYIRSTLKYIS